VRTRQRALARDAQAQDLDEYSELKITILYFYMFSYNNGSDVRERNFAGFQSTAFLESVRKSLEEFWKFLRTIV
jgi:hypothetical protein